MILFDEKANGKDLYPTDPYPLSATIEPDAAAFQGWRILRAHLHNSPLYLPFIGNNSFETTCLWRTG